MRGLSRYICFNPFLSLFLFDALVVMLVLMSWLSAVSVSMVSNGVDGVDGVVRDTVEKQTHTERLFRATPPSLPRALSASTKTKSRVRAV